MIEIKTKIPLCYLQTKVLFLDDDSNFLRILESLVSSEHQAIFRQNPIKAKDDISKSARQNEFLRPYFKFLQEICGSDESEFFTNPEQVSRFDFLFPEPNELPISVVFVDYDMPGINGETLLRQLQDESVEPEMGMLTAGASETMGIGFHNDSLITVFLSKNDDNLEDKLNQQLAELKIKFFNRLSEQCYAFLGSWLSSLFSDREFISFFNKVLQENNIEAFSLIDTEGSFYMRTNSGKDCWLLVRRHDVQVKAIKDHFSSDELVDFDVTESQILSGEKVISFINQTPQSHVAQPFNWCSEKVLCSFVMY